ncbi:MAG TPA: sugar phosphate isomerase/epimerase [Pirellulaceae bacterium]|nr:sugar phosphate isomerase/epimerase [Pirellulaceae bacterium]
MFVAASTACFPDLSFDDAIERISDLEFASVEIAIHEQGNHLRPSQVAESLEMAVVTCNSVRRMDVTGFSLDFTATGEEFFHQFDRCCQLAKSVRVVSLTVPSGELGTPFNEEVEKFKRLAQIAEQHGVRVGMRSQYGRLSGDVDTVSVICGHVKGVGLSLDPSQYIYRHERPANFDKLLPYVQNVYLRDSNKDHLQVRVGQGVIDFGRLITQLAQIKYNRALVIEVLPEPDIHHFGELRKLRLLLESLLV